MRQYFDAKRQYRHAIVFFRMGDFYEMFYEDALVASRALDLTLTSRSKDASGTAVPMCGVPFHAADGYIARLVRKGYRVAICEQVEDPKKAKGVVKREVVRVVSPGTLTDVNYLDEREPAFLMAVVADGRRRPARAGRVRRRAGRCVDRRVRRGRVRGAGGARVAARRNRGAAAARDRRGGRLRHSQRRARDRAGVDCDHRNRRLAFRAGCRAADDGRSAARQRPRGLRPGTASAGGVRRRRAGAAPARYAESRPGARPHRAPAPGRRRPADRSDHAEAPRDRGVDRRRARRIAARRNRSHGHADGLPLAAGPGCCARSPRSKRSAIGWMPSRSWPSGPPIAASCARPSSRSRISSG